VALENSHPRIVREISALDFRPYPKAMTAVQPKNITTGQPGLFRNFVEDIFATAYKPTGHDPRTHISQNYKFDRGV